MLVGEHGLEAVTQEQLSAHVSLEDMCADERNSSYLFSSFFRNPLFQLRFGIGVLQSPTLVRGPFLRRCCMRALSVFSSG